ncbi:hypothetical protein ACFWP5_24430 [Streptomyces sp. NPDC058469]|uniref:hypothetical protein n=1 Tax=Streptomyces sp. NPDC058469 TaxID=3346514 RepID=UPI0036698EDE
MAVPALGIGGTGRSGRCSVSSAVIGWAYAVRCSARTLRIAGQAAESITNPGRAGVGGQQQPRQQVRVSALSISRGTSLGAVASRCSG